MPEYNQITEVFQKLQSSEVEIPGVTPFTKLPHVTLRILCLNVQFTFPAQSLEFPTTSLSELVQLLEKENQCQ